MNFVSKIKCKIKENLFLFFQTALIVLLIFLVGVFVVVMCFEDLKRIFKILGVSGNENPKYEVLKFLGIAMGGILVALQALMSYKRAKAMEDTAKAQADAAQAQARANENTEQGLRQERLKNAIEHLGHERDSVRLGGAYELFHLVEKDNKDLRKTAFDILCAHIRQTTGEKEYQKNYKSKPSEEVQSLLRLLFVQEHEVFKGLHIDLRESYLNGANLREARLQRAVLTGAHLEGASLIGAHLQEANLSKAHLRETSLGGAKLQKAELSMAHLEGAFLIRAHLQGADLLGTHLQGTFLYEASLQGAFLLEPYLQGADLREADLRGVKSRAWRSLTFVQCMRASIGDETDLSTVIFEGGLRQEYVDYLIEDLFIEGVLSEEKANDLREKLEPHIDKPISNELPENSGAVTGAYTKEEAEQWIAEYKEAMSELPEGDS